MDYPSMPKNKRYELKIPNITGGINTSVDDTLIEDNQSPSMNNMWISNGNLKTRPGMKLSEGQNLNTRSTKLVSVPNAEIHLSNMNEFVPPSDISDAEADLGYKLNSEYVFKLVVFSDKLYALCISGTNSDMVGEAFAFTFVDRGNTPQSILDDIESNVPISSISIFNDSLVTDIRDSYFSATKVSTIKGFVQIDEMFYDISLSLLNDIGQLSPTYTLSIIQNETAYTPTTVINKNPDGTGGDLLEDYNMLSTAFKEEFMIRQSMVNDGELFDKSTYGYEFKLAVSIDPITESKPVIIDMYGVFKFSEYYGNAISYHARATTVGSTEAEDSYYTYFEYLDDDDNVLTVTDVDSNSILAFHGKSPVCEFNLYLSNLDHGIIYKECYVEKVIITANYIDDGRAEKLKKFTLSTWFGGARSGLAGGTRLFLSGSPDYINIVRWSELNDSTYFPENNFAEIGSKDTPITALSKQDNYLAVFKPNETYSIEYAYDTDSTTNKTTVYFPVTPVSPMIGCDCPNSIQLINDKLTWAHSSGKVYTLISANQFSERSIRELSLHIRSLLVSEGTNLKSALSADYNGNYMLFVGDKVYVWNYDSSPLYNYSSSEKTQERLAWFMWTLPQAPYSVFPVSDKLMAYSQQTVSGTPVKYAQKLFEFVSNANDETIVYTDGVGALTDNPIISTVRSKRWDFGKPQIFKRINQMFLGAGSDSDFDMTVKFSTERGDIPQTSSISNRRNLSKGADVFQLRPNINKTRTFGFELSASNPVEIHSTTINFETLGAVR